MKIGFFITARLKSSRLKNKILLDLNGKTVIDRVIERCKAVQGVDGVVLCTSTNPQDSILYENALKNNIQFYPGSEDDVLVRLENAALYYGYDAFLSITADNPLFSIYASQLCLDRQKFKNPDFIFVKGLPIGCNLYSLNTKALVIANHMKKITNTEIWGPFLKRSDFFNIYELEFSGSVFAENIRLTVDYYEDYLLINQIYHHFNSNTIPSTESILQLLKHDEKLSELNNKKKQFSITEEMLNKINQDFNTNIESGRNFAMKINHTLIPNHYVEVINI